ncbi:uncharacterized protein LOC110460911 [Mizuhopecten yessoensis]|uniref:uncharacterized protein LOC110460911 n=1 Tax=Mizuhopecten yessoensis TaxID=6573 RepID=UPI000B45F6CA|nr:uncharacterized protein LOC110460911 [Mizuhopecten yessoensis]
MKHAHKSLYFAVFGIILAGYRTVVSGCTVNYTLPELGRVNRPRLPRITAEYLSSVGRVLYPRITHMVRRYTTRIPPPTDDLSSTVTEVHFPEQGGLNAEGLSEIYHSMRMFYGILHNMEVIEHDLHYALYTSNNFKPPLRVLKRMMLTPINLLQVTLFHHDDIEDSMSTVSVNTVCNYRNVYNFVRKSIRDLETMENFFMQMALLQV